MRHSSTSIGSFHYVACAVVISQLLFVSAIPINLTVRAVPTQFVQSSNIACNYGTNSNYLPTFAISSTGVWLGSCNTLNGLVTLDTNGLFTSLVSDNSYGTHFQFAANSTALSPILVPIDGLVQNAGQSNSNPVGKLHLNPFQWQSFRNDSACMVNGSPASSRFFAYSAASDTFYTIPLCSNQGIRMRQTYAPFEQKLDAYCLPDPQYVCYAKLALYNDGNSDHLFQIAGPTSLNMPSKLFRQSLFQGGPLTNLTVVATGPTILCSSLSIQLQIHPRGKMLFGACDKGLFYADLSDPFPTTIPTVQFVSTCSSSDGDLANPLVVTNDRVYVTCGSDLRAYSLAVNSNGIITVSDTNYISLSPSGCDASASSIIPSMVVGRPDAIWTRCGKDLYSNICGFGYALSVATAGDTYSCTACPSGTYQSSYGFSSDQSCTTCAVGTYLASPTDPNCTYCAAGKYQPSTSATTCLLCALGTYQPAAGASSCLTCDLPYTTTSSVGATNSSQCIQEHCEIPGSNPLYCVSVFGSAALHQPLPLIVSAGITILVATLSVSLL